MTVIAGCVKGKEAWIACDTLGSNGATKQDLGSKIICRNNWKAGIAGCYRTMDIIRESSELGFDIKNVNDVRKWRDALISELRECGARWRSDVSDSLPADDASLLISFSGRMFLIEADYQIHEVKNYSSCGSGTQFALGSMHSTYKNASPKECVTMAVAAAIEHACGCGGRIFSECTKR